MLSFIYKDILKKRAFWANWEKERDAKYKCPASVNVQMDVRLGDGGFDAIDIYRPAENVGKLPVMINIHGGGMVMGTKHQNMQQCVFFASLGFLVIGIEYPLVPEANFFTQLDSIARTLDKLSCKIEKFGGDAQRVSLTGDSAGAFFAFYTVACRNNPVVAKAAGIVPTKLEIKKLGLSSGLFYSTKVEGNGIFLLRNDFFGKGWKKHPFAKYLNPENAEVIRALPPCILSTSKGDFLRKHTLKLEKAMNSIGCEHKLLFIDEKVEHAFNALYPELSASKSVNESIAKYLK